MTVCSWPEGFCKCAEAERTKLDPRGRVWMHCETGLSLTKASLARFTLFCLRNDIQIGDLWAFNAKYDRSLVCASIKIRPDQFEEFSRTTGGKLCEPPRIKLNHGRETQ